MSMISKQLAKRIDYELQQSRLLRVPEPVYQNWIRVISSIYSSEEQHKQRALKRMVNEYMLSHHAGYKIQAFGEVGYYDSSEIRRATGRSVQEGFYLRIRPMFEDELLQSARYQELYKKTANIEVLDSDPMWTLETSTPEFFKELAHSQKQIEI